MLTEVHLATVQRRDGAVRFRFAPHRRFQEFFATRAVRAPGRIDPDDLLWTDVWRDTTVTLLETGNPRDLEPIHAQIRGITALWADAHGLPERIDGVPITHLQAADLTQNDQQQQGSGTHQAFIWPERALHLLGILNNVSVRRGTSPDPGTATNVDRLLLAAYATGKRLDQKTAVKVAHAGSRDGAVWLLNASFQSNSAMLADVALEQAKRMRNLPAELLPRIREAYVLPVITGAIAKRRLGLLSSMVGQPGGFDGGACATVTMRDGTLQAR